MGAGLQVFDLQPRSFMFDYPWKLPGPTVWLRFVVWSLCGLHQQLGSTFHLAVCIV